MGYNFSKKGDIVKLNVMNMNCLLKVLSCDNASLTCYEMKCFLSWISHKKGYNASQSQVSKSTGISRQNVSRAFKGLVKKEMLVVVRGKSNGVNTRRTPVYDLHVRIYQAINAMSNSCFPKDNSKTVSKVNVDDIEKYFSEDEQIEQELNEKLQKKIDSRLLKQLKV